MALVGLHPDQTEALAGALRRVRNRTDDLAMDVHQALALSELDAPGVLAGLEDLGRTSSVAGGSLRDKAHRLQGFHLSVHGLSSHGLVSGSERPGPRPAFAPSGSASIRRRGQAFPLPGAGTSPAPGSQNQAIPAPDLGSGSRGPLGRTMPGRQWTKAGGGGPEDSRPELQSPMETTSGSWRPGVKTRVISHSTSGQVGTQYEATSTETIGSVELQVSGSALAGAEYDAEWHSDIDLKKGRVGVGGSTSGFVGLSAESEFTATAGPVVGTVGAHAAAGAGGEISGSAVFDPKKGELGAKASVEAELAVSVEVDGSIELGDSVTAKAQAEAMAGLSLKAKGEVNVTMEEITASWEVGAALGVGGGFSVDVSFSPEGVIDDIGDVAANLDINPFNGGFDLNPFA